MIAVSEELEQSFLQLAEIEHKPVNKLVEMALTGFLEDYHDARIVEAAIERLERGESELISIEDAERMLSEMDG